MPPGLEAEVWRRPERDAANGLYFLMRFHGRPVGYDDVLSALPSGEGRVSIESVRGAAERLGFDCGVYRCTVADLRSLNRPVIAYTEGGELQSGSFAILLNTGNPDDSEAVTLILSGGFATLRYLPLDEFRRQWSGYVLMARPPGGRLPWLWLAFLSAGVLVGLGLIAGQKIWPRTVQVAGPTDATDSGGDHDADERQLPRR